MKKFQVVAAIGTVIAAAAIVFAFRGGWKGRTDAEKGVPLQATTYDSAMSQSEGIGPYLCDLSFLTEDEKAQLFRDEEELRPILVKMSELSKKIQSVQDSVLDKHRDLFEKEEELISQGSDLRDRVTEEFSEEPITTENWRKFIEASKTLNEEEKQKLLRLEDELEELDGKLQRVYEEADRAVEPYDSELEECDRKRSEIYERSRSIYDKIYDNNVESTGFQSPSETPANDPSR